MTTNNCNNFNNPIGVTNGGIGTALFDAYTVICGGILSTSALQNVSSTGNSGENLFSNGSSSLPSWQLNGASLQVATVVLTSAQVKSLNGTPITLIAAQGAGTVIRVMDACAKLTYGGTNVFVAGASQNIQLRYNNGSGQQAAATILNSTAIAGNTNRLGFNRPAGSGSISTTMENSPIVIWNGVATEISGNAANNNTITVKATYVVLTI